MSAYLGIGKSGNPWESQAWEDTVITALARKVPSWMHDIDWMEFGIVPSDVQAYLQERVNRHCNRVNERRREELKASAMKKLTEDEARALLGTRLNA